MVGKLDGEEFYSSESTMIRKGEMLPLETYEVMGIENPSEWYETGRKISRIMFDMMEMPEFRAEVERQYQEKMQDRLSGLVNDISKWASDIEWPMWEDYLRWNRGGYWEDIKMMTEWIMNRAAFFEREYGKAGS